jgi:hypothetical protein
LRWQMAPRACANCCSTILPSSCSVGVAGQSHAPGR